MVRVLLIAPDLGLATDTEMELISGAFFALTPLRGVITQERIIRATNRDKFDIIHLAAHGSAAGVQLSDGLLSKEQLGQIAKQVNCELVFLNACDSALTAQYLADRGVPLVLANTNETLDGDALRTAAYFYSNLAAYGGDYRKAYERVSPRDGSLAIFVGAGYVDKLIQPIVAAIQRLTNGLDQLRQQMVGGQKNVLRVLAGAMAVMVLVNGLALWGIAGAATARAQSPAALSRVIDALPAAARAGLLEQLMGPSPLPVPTSPLATQPATKTREAEEEEEEEETRMMETRMVEEEAEATRLMETRVEETRLAEMELETRMAATATAVAMLRPTQTETQEPPPTATVTATAVPTATATPLPTATDGSSPEGPHSPTAPEDPLETPLPPELQWTIERGVIATLTAITPNLCRAICR